ncbi:metal-dependent phosphohydrolase hd sub domain protein [Flammeovirgaceae bacterium 311]|nr:metal-dependent phosphohydrolase hd sub domain protein [Flammeovirgaceae bacterium 311]
MGNHIAEKICGVLHRLVEDTHWPFKDLEREGFSPEIIDALRCVTKNICRKVLLRLHLQHD